MQINTLLVTLVRHGESQDNLQSIWAGFRDSPLSSTGNSQARALGQAFSNVSLTAIYSSDLKRAAMTAEEILKANRSIPPPPLVQSKSLREQNFGQAEGKSWAAAEWANPSHGEDGRTFRFKDGESLEQVNARMAKAVRQFVLPQLEALRKKPSSSLGDTPHICIVAHGIAIAELLRVFMSLHDDQPHSPWQHPRITYKRVRLENTGWTRLELCVPALDLEGRSLSPAPPASLIPSPQTSTQPSSGTAGHTDFGEIQADLVENAADQSWSMQCPSTSTTWDSIPTSPLPNHHPATLARATFVKIVCQNNVDHLRGFALQPPSMSSGGPASQLAGGPPSGLPVLASPTAVSGVATSGPASSSTSSSVLAGAPGAGPSTGGLPTSATLASIASNPTMSTTASSATLPPPSTPGAGSVPTASRSLAPTPASARSLSSYDAKMMAREIEKAGAASMLTGSEGVASGSSGAGPGSSPSQGMGSHAGGMASTIANAGSDRQTLQPPSASSTSGLHGLGSSQMPSSAGSLYSSYASSGNVIGANSPNGASSFAFPSAPGASSDVWQSVCVRVLPLFNGEGLRSSIEELNDSVSVHVRRTLDRGPARALDSLSLDLVSLASSGTLTLNSKLLGLEDSRLLVRLVEIWTFFLGQVLPYIEGCFLPLQTDPVLVSLTSNARAANAAAAAQANFSPTMASSALRTEKINVRKILLGVFRDRVILPIHERLFYLFSHLGELDPSFSSGGTDEANTFDGSKQIYLRLLQMTSVLSSVLSDDEAQNAMDGLLRALRMGSKGATLGKTGTQGTGLGLGMRNMSPVQRSNRRGWIAQKARKHGINSSADSFGLGPKVGNVNFASAMGGAGSGSATNGAEGQAMRSGPGVGAGHMFGLHVGGRNHLSEEEYLTTLKSPDASPALSTPGARYPPTPPSKDVAISDKDSGGTHTSELGRAEEIEATQGRGQTPGRFTSTVAGSPKTVSRQLDGQNPNEEEEDGTPVMMQDKSGFSKLESMVADPSRPGDPSDGDQDTS